MSAECFCGESVSRSVDERERGKRESRERAGGTDKVVKWGKEAELQRVRKKWLVQS
jgi:hypothetical protein